MIRLKTASQIQQMRESCQIAAGARELAGKLIRPGLCLMDLDRAIRSYMEDHGAKPSFLGYGGYPASACLSVNEVVIHGIPDSRVLKEGDIISVDVGAYKNGYHGDCADTFAVGEISPEAQRLIDVTRQSFFDGIAMALPGNRIGDVSNRIQQTAEGAGFSVVREYIGHGVGENLHEEPDIPNYGKPGRGPRLWEGMTIAVEPMVCQFGHQVKVLDDQWTVVTVDRGLAAHYENTVAVTPDGAWILTQV